jgi:RNA polymerase sigma-70 factor, ECF subfamily
MAPPPDPAAGSDEPPPSAKDFEALFRRYYGPLVGFFCNRGFARDTAEDLAQETLLSAYRGYQDFRGGSSDATWLFVIAGNVWRNELRKRHVRKRKAAEITLGDEIAERLTSPAPSAFEQVLADEHLDLLRQAVDELPPQMKRCLLLHFGQHHNSAEIAAILGVQVETVRSLISQAKTRLRMAMSARPGAS